MEVTLRAPGMPGTLIRMAASSQFYLDPQVLDSPGLTTIEHLAGQLSLKVEKLASNASLDIRSRQSVIGVRGTEFKVWEAPTLDLLVSVTEGTVGAKQGTKEIRVPSGSVAYKSVDESFESRAVGINRVVEFEEHWFDTVLSDLEVLARPRLIIMDRKWESRTQSFSKALLALQGQSALLKDWKSDVSAGKTIATDVLLRRQKTISPLLLNLRKVLFFLERDTAWVKSLEEYPKILEAHRDLAQKAQSKAILRDLSIARRLLAEYKVLYKDSPLGDMMEDDFFGEDLF